MMCKNCFPPYSYPLRKSGWADPEFRCPVCKAYFNNKGEEMPAPKIKKAPSGLILDDMDVEEIYESFYDGMW